MKKGKLREWLYSNGYTLTEFAEVLGCSRITLWAWMGGEFKPRPSQFKKIKKITKNEISSIEDILG